MYSQERRRGRYQIIFIWKLSQGLVTGYSLPFQQNERRHETCFSPTYDLWPVTPQLLLGRQEVKGARLFILAPKELRNMSGVPVVYSLDMFKSCLDAMF